MNYQDIIGQYNHVSQTTQSNYSSMASIFQRCKNLLKNAQEHNSNKRFLQRTQDIIEIMNEMKKTSHISLFAREPEIAKAINQINVSMYNMVHNLIISGAASSEYDALIECFQNIENFFSNSSLMQNTKEDIENNLKQLSQTKVLDL